MRVANITFMLDRLGRDCAPLQFLRELTQNSIEAVRESGKAEGEVVWDVDWNRYDLTGVYKLACIDTGVGMTGPEMLDYLNQLSSSIHQQSFEGNYGVGAKVAAATRNHAGMIYLSWKDGVGSMIHLWRDLATEKYGLQQIRWPDGSYHHWAHVTDDIKPDLIAEHGTMVILLGNSSDEDTMVAPKEAASPSRWVARYLNTRYFRFREGITVRAREGWENPRSNTDANVLRRITGQQDYLERHRESSGTLELTGADARWWILKDEPALTQNSGFIASSGHTAALYQGELYEVLTGRGGVARLQLFGVVFGYNRVVIYLEPRPAEGQTLTSNTARTHLLINDEPLPWAEWAAEFRERMPQDIKDLMDEVTAHSTGGDHKEAIKERLRQIRDLLRLSRYRRTRTGELTVDQDTVGGRPRASKDERTGGDGPSGRKGGRAGDVYALFLADEGAAGEEVLSGLDPDVRWVSAADGTRNPPDLEDRAAKYLPEENLILINGDFRVFEDMTSRWCKRYEHVSGARPVIEDVVREWFEQALIETVVGVHTLIGSPEWTMEDVKFAWSQESLTAAVMQRYHVDVAVRRTLGAKLGSLKDKAA